MRRRRSRARSNVLVSQVTALERMLLLGARWRSKGSARRECGAFLLWSGTGAQCRILFV